MISNSDEVGATNETHIIGSNEVIMNEDGNNVTFSAKENDEVMEKNDEEAEYGASDIYPIKGVAATTTTLQYTPEDGDFIKAHSFSQSRITSQRKRLLMFFLALAVVSTSAVVLFIIVKNNDTGSSSQDPSDLSSSKLGVNNNAPSDTPTLAPTFPKLSYDIIPIGDVSIAESLFVDTIEQETEEVDGVLYYEITGDRKALVTLYERDCKTSIDDNLVKAKPIYGPITENGLHIYFALFFFVDFEVMPYTTLWSPVDKSFQICSRIDLVYNGKNGPEDLDGDGVAGGIGDSVAFHKTITTWTIYLDGGINTGVDVGTTGPGGIEAVVEAQN